MSLNPIDPSDPTVLPPLLRAGHVITTDPKTGVHGEWTFDDAERVGNLLSLGCHDPEGATVVFVVAPSQPLHIKPRNASHDLRGAA